MRCIILSEQGESICAIIPKFMYMKSKFVSLYDMIDVPESFQREISSLKSSLNEQNVPTWLLIPERKGGEHATNMAWRGIMIAKSSSDDNVLKTRIALETEGRHRSKSDVAEVPDEIRSVLTGVRDNREELEMCIAKLRINRETTKVEDIEVGFEMTDEQE